MLTEGVIRGVANAIILDVMFRKATNELPVRIPDLWVFADEMAQRIATVLVDQEEVQGNELALNRGLAWVDGYKGRMDEEPEMAMFKKQLDRLTDGLDRLGAATRKSDEGEE